jgi:glycerol uptake facilitator-like aquaporin
MARASRYRALRLTSTTDSRWRQDIGACHREYGRIATFTSGARTGSGTHTTHRPHHRAPDTPRVGAAAKYIVEGIGTFALVFTVGTAVSSGSSLTPLAIGAALMAMVVLSCVPTDLLRSVRHRSDGS